MKTIKNEKAKKRKRKVAGRFACLVLVVLFVLFFLIRCAFPAPMPVSEYEQNVNAITEIDYSKQQEALNAIVEEGKMNVNYCSNAIFDGAVSQKFNIKNIRNNHYPILFSLYDEKEQCIYASKKIEPGYEMNQIELQKELTKGTHQCTLQVGYAEEGNVTSVFPITIEVR